MVTKVEEPSKYGVVVSDDKGAIQRFVEKPQTFVGNMINAGIYIFNPTILSRIELKPTSIEKEIFPKMAEEGQLYSMPLEGFWMDVGQPKDFLHGMRLYLPYLKSVEPQRFPNGPNFIGAVLVDETAKIGKDCLIGPNVSIGPNCIIGDGVRINNSSIHEGSEVKDHSWVSQSIIGWQSTVGRWARVQNITVIGQDVHIKDELFINGGKILPHKTITDSIPNPEIVM